MSRRKYRSDRIHTQPCGQLRFLLQSVLSDQHYRSGKLTAPSPKRESSILDPSLRASRLGAE